MAHDKNNLKQKTMLHELLKEDQEPFHLSKYTSQKRSMLRNQTKSLPVKRRAASSNNLCRRAACFFSLHDDPTKSPFLELRSPPAIHKSPSNSPNGAVFMDIPSRIASVLLEAAVRIQKPKPRSSSNDGLGLFGSFLKRLKRKSRKRDLRSALKQVEQRIKTASSGERKNESSVDWIESHCEDDKSLDLEAPSTSGYGSEDDDAANSDFDFPETRFCVSPFVFSVRLSLSSSGGCTPELCSPVGSPGCRVIIQENATDNEEKEQCSPVSVLDPPLDEEGDEKETEEEEEDDDYDLESSYANVQRAKQQLLQRLRRFERLAELDPIELERKLTLESSDDEYQVEEFEPNLSENEGLLIRSPNLLQHSHSTNHRSKRMLVSNVAIEEKCEITCTRLDSKREVVLNTIDMMMELDFKREIGAWTKCREEVEETTQDLEVLIFDLLMEELI